MNSFPVSVFISLGSNLGARKAHLDKAILLISQLPSTTLVSCSGMYTTAAWGKTDQPDFLNMVIQISSSLLPDELMKSLLRLEEQIGRVRDEQWGPRIIDLDILFYGNKIHLSPTLTVPHPEIQNRNFVLVPLQEIAPDFVHPVLKKRITLLLAECPDKLTVLSEIQVSHG
ncbi:MAG: 2-amino-4-hydroxy-6-hydroxymethyldihydropteridine diphosphokinase [Bacteroidota bacterium]|nr:2-amino-4-hydroxy-6-hydroxymethyldihydropteridine diphosphokinase [Bacteroidota bacterium]